MRKFLTISLLLLATLLPLAGQSDSLRLGFSVRGSVWDARTGKAVEAAHISIPGRDHATVSNADGAFTLKSDAVIRALTVSHLGYKTQTLSPEGNEVTVNSCRSLSARKSRTAAERMRL